jgi:galactose-1-phosphate uridylyltransferase
MRGDTKVSAHSIQFVNQIPRYVAASKGNLPITVGNTVSCQLVNTACTCCFTMVEYYVNKTDYWKLQFENSI